MQSDFWDELLAQVESHGPDKVQFELDQEDPETGANLLLDVIDVEFSDNVVRVVLS